MPAIDVSPPLISPRRCRQLPDAASAITLFAFADFADARYAALPFIIVVFIFVYFIDSFVIDY